MAVFIIAKNFHSMVD